MGSVCKRIERNQKHFVTTWRSRRRRWSKGMRSMTARKHYVPRPQGHMGRPPGSGQVAYQGYFEVTYAHGGKARIAR